MEGNGGHCKRGNYLEEAEQKDEQGRRETPRGVKVCQKEVKEPGRGLKIKADDGKGQRNEGTRGSEQPASKV